MIFSRNTLQRYALFIAITLCSVFFRFTDLISADQQIAANQSLSNPVGQTSAHDNKQIHDDANEPTKQIDPYQAQYGENNDIQHDHNQETLDLLSEQEFAQNTTAQDEQKEQIGTDETTDDIEQDTREEISYKEPRKINQIIISGNKHVSEEAILSRIPYRVGEIFDPNKTRQLIHNLYYDLKRFRNIWVFGENIGDDLINVHVRVEEKKPLKDVIFKGNKQLADKEIKKKINFEDVPAIDAEELKKFAQDIKKLYLEKGYHLVEIDTELKIDDDDTATAVFIIKEHAKSLVKKIQFTGNRLVSSKKLRNIIFTREDWVLGFLDKAGTYHPDRVQSGDKYVIEQFYQSNGYLNAKVTDIHIDTDPKTKHLTITFDIQEGDLYTIKEVKAPGNELLSEQYLLSTMPIRPGDIYSRELVTESIKILETVWGNKGYIYAHIEPSIQPDEDTKTVNLAFYSEPGNQVLLNKITIKGNKKTRDKVMRRQIALEEGELITAHKMDAAKERVESLGYFDQRDGVNWKTTRLTEDSADLDLIVREAKTGNAHLKLTFGGKEADIRSPISSVSVEGNIADTNLFGSGIHFNLTGKLGKEEQTLIFNITQPWLFDRPIYGKFDLYHKRLSYDNFNFTQPVNERYTGGAMTTGFVTGVNNSLLNDTFVRLSLGIDSIKYERQPIAAIKLIDPVEMLQANQDYQSILDKMFANGDFFWLALNLGQDKRNHPIHPSRGHSWLARSQVSVPSLESNIGFHKLDLDVNWFTPLIGEYDLVLRLHAYLGVVTPFKNRTVPYRELFHIGGPASVRGFLFGEIGPQFSISNQNDSIGGRKAVFWNAELIFPITPDFSMKGVLFYDGGTGWSNPFVDDVSNKFIKNNSFSYRHAVGVGVRLMQPMPIRVDWGFKLDPRTGESGHEVHFGMTYDW